MNHRKTLLAIALASAFAFSNTAVYAEGDEKQEAPKPEFIAQSDDSSTPSVPAPTPELIAEGDEKPTQPAPELIAEGDEKSTQPAPELIAEGDEKPTQPAPELIAA